jgi:cytochrome b subunit of formate dehydrogenase
MRRTTSSLLSILFAALLGMRPGTSTAEPTSQPASAPAKRDNKACLECHVDGVDAKLRVDPKRFAGPPHSEENGVSCVDCHTRAAAVADVSDHGKLGPASCTGCHEADAAMAASVHGRRRHHGTASRKLPGCADCHGSGHAIRPAASSPIAPREQPRTCGRCHEGTSHTSFLRSVHGRELASGKTGPTCSTCHGSHAIAAADILRNPAFKQQITRTCGACHKAEMKAYGASSHGVALLERGSASSAACVDCHKSHEILPPKDPGSAVHRTRVVDDCAGCHADARLIKREHLPADVVRSYQLSYHGRAAGVGSTAIAVCSSCHEHHAIFPSSDPRSSVHPGNLQSSCGKCHPGAGPNFVAGKIHVVDERQANYWAWFAKSAYTWLIVILIGGMALHNLLDFLRKQIMRARRQASLPHVIRMDRQERTMHALLLTSFLTLVYTGFALIYPRAWWAAPLGWLSESESFRGQLHRGAGVALTLIMVQHLWFLLLTRRGREQRRELRPRLRDVRDLWHNLLFYLGRRPTRPRFGRFSYMEKAEYWALVWGTVVMVATGFVLWFEVESARLMPRWLWEVFQTVHRYEAILAALAILVWHFYYVFANPDEAPMALTWLTGKMPLEDLALQHPEELARLERAEGAEGKGEGER